MAPIPSFVKACQEYFTQEPHGRKVEISEFKALSTEDKIELSALLMPIVPHMQYTGPAA
jgi:hypothetical protein